MAKKHYNYASTPQQKCGLMKCAVCGKKIENCEFKYYMACDRWGEETGYVTFHRSCTETDPRWAELDATELVAKKHRADMLAACIYFKAQWNITDLDELIVKLS